MQLKRHGLAAVLIATLLACLPALGNGLPQDDLPQVMVEGSAVDPNPLVAELHPWRDYFTGSSWASNTEPSLMYRPLTVLSYALVRRAFVRLPPHAADSAAGPIADDIVRAQALPQHVVNVLLHVLATALVSLMLRELAVRPAAALAGTAVFGLHAVHAEVLGPVVGRAELLAFAGGAAASWLALRAATARTPARAAAAAVASTLCFFVAFASKESALCWAPSRSCSPWRAPGAATPRTASRCRHAARR